MLGIPQIILVPVPVVSGNTIWQKLAKPVYPRQQPSKPPSRTTRQAIPSDIAKEALPEARRLIAETRATKILRELHP
jgi:hypothetical protein